MFKFLIINGYVCKNIHICILFFPSLHPVYISSYYFLCNFIILNIKSLKLLQIHRFLKNLYHFIGGVEKFHGFMDYN